MKEVIEIEGKTVDEAIEKACREFGVPREKLSIDILTEGSSGFLGIGSKKARIMARLLSLHIHEEERSAISLPAMVEETVAKKTETEQLAVSPAPSRESAGTGLKPATKPSPPSSSREAGDNEGMGIRAKELLENLLLRMSISAKVSLEESADAIVLNIRGEGEGLLIGKRGQNLDALQHIINKAVNKQGTGKKMIIVDTEAYRKRREESLVFLAERLGQKVKKTRKTVTVSNMNAHDRRIIHMALQGDTALLTKSRGEGEYRKIIIMPARRERNSDRARSNADTATE